MYQSHTHIRVRYGETDQMNIVYYGNYALYYEVGRVEVLRQLGLSYKDLEEIGIMMPVIENHSIYLGSAVYDDLLKIVVTIPEKPTVKICFQYEIYNEQPELIHKGKTILVFINKTTKRPCRPPENFMKVLEPYFKSN